MSIKVFLGVAAMIVTSHVNAVVLQPDYFVSDNGINAVAVKEAAMNYVNFWNTGKKEYAEAALEKNFIDMTPPEGRKVGIDGVLEASNIIRQVVPNLHIEVEHLLITGNYATVRYRFKGNLTGAMIDNKDNKDNKDKGQSIDFPVVDIYYVVNGKIHKTWHHLKYNTFFKQVK